jgi:hypothetical protein
MFEMNAMEMNGVEGGYYGRWAAMYVAAARQALVEDALNDICADGGCS